MKKLTAITLFALAPFTAFAADKEFDISKDTRFFIEYNMNFFTTSETTASSGGSKTDEDSIEFNSGLGITVGADFNGVQLSIAPSYSKGEDVSMTEFDLKLDIPFGDNKLQPYVSLGAGIGFISYNLPDVSVDPALMYGIGGGVKYNLDDNAFIKVALMYMSGSFDIEGNGITVETEMKSYSIMTSLGYKF